MALIKCMECGNAISSGAKACPKCGHEPPKKTSNLTWAIAAIMAVSIGSAVLHSGDAEEAKATHRAATTPEQPVTRPVAETHVTRQAQETGISDQKLAGLNLAFKAHGVSDAQRDEAIKNLNLSISEAAGTQ